MNHKKFARVTAVTVLFASSLSCMADLPKVAEMKCGGSIVRIESYCKMDSKEKLLNCSKQILLFEDLKTHKKHSRLLQDEPEFLGSPISEWACSQGKSSKYIEVMRCLGGNCGIGNAVEFEIWSLTGELLAPYDISFSRKIKELGIGSPSDFKKLPLTK